MSTLFSIETDRARLTWSELRDISPVEAGSPAPPLGLLALRPMRAGAQIEAMVGDTGPVLADSPLSSNSGPALFEQLEYRVRLRGEAGRDVAIEHRDPLILNRFEDDERGRFYGLVNFRSQIGISTFRVLVDGSPEFEFDVEVFPTKLDYKSDYDEILADVSDTLTGLAFEYLRATWRGAESVDAPAPTSIEWLTLLRNVVDEFERALRHIASRPLRGLRRTEVARRSEQVHRVDSGIRSFLRRQAGRGTAVEVIDGLPIPARIAERRAEPTLDTPEHRWLAAQVDRIRRRLVELAAVERRRMEEGGSERSARIVSELEAFEVRSNRWCRLEPLQAATDQPPPGFASLQLLTAPGYREAYRACMTLSLGLRLDGGPLQLSVKDLNLLYEYWCYLALLRIVAEETKTPIDPRRLLEVRNQGLSVLLRQGNESKMPFRLPNGRKITVRYNPAMRKGALVPQRPDLLLTLEHPDWPAVHLVLDAKYRVDTSSEYAGRYGSAGPPEDALNAMHRYRDAILDEVDGATRRTVVQAAALFPLRVDSEKYETGRLWRALGRIGVGAIPLLPGQDHLLRAWLRRWLEHGGWDTADKAIDHLAIRQAAEWRRAAAEPVLIGALRGEDPGGHLAWIRDERRYYTPHAKDQPRLFAATQIVFYEPARVVDDAQHGAVRQGAKVLNCRIVRRSEVLTPWTAARPDEEVVLYELAPLTRLPREVLNEDETGRGARVGVRRWSSRLGLERARTLAELFLESEPEWRLYEELRARDVRFQLRVLPPKLRRAEDLRGRVQVVLDDARVVTWAGAAGFLLRDAAGRETSVANVPGVVAALELSASSSPILHSRDRDAADIIA
jgi:uncharacterized protein